MRRPFIVLLVMFLSIYVISFVSCRDHSQKPGRTRQAQVKPEHDKLGAFTIAQDFIESNLKCPRTAKWPWIDYTSVTVPLGNGRYQVSSYLDAQNGFGAMVRIHFVCTVEHISGDRWRLIKLTI